MASSTVFVKYLSFIYGYLFNEMYDFFLRTKVMFFDN